MKLNRMKVTPIEHVRNNKSLSEHIGKSSVAILR